MLHYKILKQDTHLIELVSVCPIFFLIFQMLDFRGKGKKKNKQKKNTFETVRNALQQDMHLILVSKHATL